MYYAILAVFLLLGVGLSLHGLQSRRRGTTALGVLVVLGTIAFFGLLNFWAEMLWFDAVGYGRRFWTVVLAKIGFAAAGAFAAGAVAWALTVSIPRRPLPLRFWPRASATVVGALWGFANWDTILLWWHGVAANVADPILGHDIGFYLFSLPFYDALYWLLTGAVVISTLAAGSSYALISEEIAPQYFQAERPDLSDGERRELSAQAARALCLCLGTFVLVLAAGKMLNRFHLLLSPLGAVTGAGWTDVYVRLPAYWVVAVVTVLVAGVLFAVPYVAPWRERFIEGRIGSAANLARIVAPPAGFLAAVWFLVLGVAPVLTQWLWVSPNEITVERPYIEHNIAFTRAAFGLKDIEEQEFAVAEELTRPMIADNQHLLSEVRLWDPRALLATYEQFQEIRLYYEFNDVDIDRYMIGDRYRQVMVSPREMEAGNLPDKSQTFVNRHFKYTHGYGLTMAPVSDFTPQGLPDLLVKDLPPQTASPQLEVKQPGIYYGEQTRSYVVANSDEEEFDYPRGESNVYIHYDGKGGVPIKNLWRKFVFGWKFGGTRLFVSGYPNPESRLMFHREVRRRVKTLAPFLTLDSDPYVVLHEGRIYWIVDAYTTSQRYPYSEELVGAGAASPLDGANYVRNSVKAVVDAYEGTVSLYVFDPDDPIVRTWQRIFPDLFKSRDEMPAGLAGHVRYPEGLLTAQGLVYSKYHMTDPAVFYNQEDLWVRATEKYYANVQPVEPYYVMWEPPDSEDAEFVLMQPFTPKNRQVLIAWMAGMCDGENYGRLLAYRFPKEKRVLGTQQVETKIDQDRFLSGQLTLWDQRGSSVIRGNLLVIPLNGTLLYVEPIYLEAESAAYPELRLVAVMHNDRLSYAESFDEALEGLFEDGEEPTPERPTSPETDGLPAELVDRANRSFERYLKRTGEQDFEAAAEELKNLQEVLKQLQGLSGGTDSKDKENGR